MPTYEYECFSCNSTFELFQRITDKPVKSCLQCGRRKVRRLIGRGGGVIFKGSGFYQTDYKNKEYTSKNHTENKTPDSKKEKAETI